MSIQDRRAPLGRRPRHRIRPSIESHRGRLRRRLGSPDVPAGRIVKYKHFPVGAKEAPRHPVYLGLRDPPDL